MRKVILFIASSLDGYIARDSGEIDWLYTDQDYGFTEFLNSIDTVLMGGKTYRQILGFGDDWPYPNQKSFVYTRDVTLKSDSPINFIHHDIQEHVSKLKKQKGKGIWLVGGSEINSLLLNAGLIDELHLFIHSVFLGSGIPVFTDTINETWFKVHDIEEFDTGLVRMRYKKEG